MHACDPVVLGRCREPCLSPTAVGPRPGQAATMAGPSSPHITLVYAGASHELLYDPATCTTVGQLAQAISSLLPDLALQTIKLLPRKKVTRGIIQLIKDAGMQLADAGIRPSSTFTVLGSTTSEVAAVQSAKELPGLAPFEHEERLAAARRSRAPGSSQLNRRHHFGSIEPWQLPGLSPPPPAAAVLLKRLATDPAIVAVMEGHGWKVGRLTEMPPEGKVGISAMCVLGYNVNQGQEISLRLRTDDLRGFRKYAKIRETLVHELAHMVWSEHDTNFKQLNSQLLREVAAHEAAAQAGGRVLGAAGTTRHWLGDDDSDEEQLAGLHLGPVAPAMAASAASSGRTLQQLAGQPSSSTGASRAASPQQQAAEAAALRWEQAQQGAAATRAVAAAAGTVPGGSAAVEAAAVEAAAVEAAAAAAGAAEAEAANDESPAGGSIPGASNGDGQMWQQVEDAMQHQDAATDQAEAAMTRLGSMEVAPQDANTHHDEVRSHADASSSAGLLAPSAEGRRHVPAAAPQQQAAAAPVSDDAHGVGQQTAAMDMEEDVDVQKAEEQQQGFGAAAAAAATSGGAYPGTASGSNSDSMQQQQQVPMQVSQQLTAPAPEAAAVEDMAAVLDDVTAHKLQRVRAALAQLSTQLAPEGAAAVRHTLHDILQRLADHPRDPKFGRLRPSNPAFQRKVGQYAAAMEVLHVAGFEVRQQPWQQGDPTVEPVLCYTRHDPGLLWLVKSLVL